MFTKFKWYILGILTVIALGGTTAYALSVSLPTTVKKGDLLVGSSSLSSLYRLATGTQGSVLFMNGTGLPGWTATSTLGFVGGGSGTPGGNPGMLQANNSGNFAGVNFFFGSNGYSFGVNSSTPNANLVVRGSSTAPTLDILKVSSSTGLSLFTMPASGIGNFNQQPILYSLFTALPTTTVASNALSTSTIMAVGTLGAWGDSLTAGTASQVPYTVTLSKNYGFNVWNAGVGGDGSTAIKNSFIAATSGASPYALPWFNIIWSGRNSYSASSTVRADIATMVAAMPSPKQFLIMSIINKNDGTEGNGGAGLTNYNLITDLNNSLAALYPNNYLDIRKILVNSYDSSNPTDVTDYASDTVPSSLHVGGDNLHLNTAGYAIVAKAVNDWMLTHTNLQNFATLSDVQRLIANSPPLGVSAPQFTVATANLPTCAFETRGMERMVNDALTPAMGAPVVAGGAIPTKVMCDQTQWIVEAGSTNSGLPVLATTTARGLLTFSQPPLLSTLLSKGCLGTDGSGNVQTGTCSGTNYWTNTSNVLYNNTGYQIGINSSTPIANLSIVGSSTAPTLPVLVVASSTNVSFLTVTQNGSTTLSSLGTGNLCSAAGNLYNCTVSGSLSGGTPGFAPYWTSATTLSKGALIDDGTHLGFTATSSTYHINIKGVGTNDDILRIQNAAGSTLLVVNSGITVNGGNVNSIGIGTSTPLGLLTIAGLSGATQHVLAVASSTGVNMFTVSSTGTTTVIGALIIPNAGASVLTAGGQISVNTSAGTLSFHDGTAQRYLNPEKQLFGFYIENPASNEKLAQYIAAATTTLTKILCVNTLGTKDSANLNLVWDTTANVATSSAASRAFTSFTACNGTTTPQSLSITGSTTIGTLQTLHFITSTASTSKMFISGWGRDNQ